MLVRSRDRWAGAKDGLNLIELMFVVVGMTITISVAAIVAKRVGLGWGLVAAPVTLIALIVVYSAFYWAVGFVSSPLGTRRRQKSPVKDQGEDKTI